MDEKPMTQKPLDEGAFISALLSKAQQDDDFRTALLERPNETVEEFLGTQLPENVNFRFVEEEPGDVVVPLPSRDAVLLEVAGGGWATFGQFISNGAIYTDHTKYGNVTEGLGYISYTPPHGS